MSSSFLLSYFRLVVSSLFNSHRDNYDFNRFGPLPVKPRRASSDKHSREIVDAIRQVMNYNPQFKHLYNMLADEESKDILVKVLAFRTLGHRKVKLPLSTPSYWNDLKRMEAMTKEAEVDPVGSSNWQLRLTDLHPFGVPAKMFNTPTGP